MTSLRNYRVLEYYKTQDTLTTYTYYTLTKNKPALKKVGNLQSNSVYADIRFNN